MLFIGLLLAGVFGSAMRIGGQGSGDEGITTRDGATFKIRVQRNEVLLRVIVRDTKGRSVSGLRKEDFRLSDNGKLQEIDQFAVESPGTQSASQQPVAKKEVGEGGASEAGPGNAIPGNYQVLYFDDVQMRFEDIARARDAAGRYIAATLTPADRVAIFTSSGRGGLDFTDDRSKLHEALLNLRPRSLTSHNSLDCISEIDPYEAYLIVRNHDAMATAYVRRQMAACEGAPLPVQSPKGSGRTGSPLDAMADRVLTESETESMNVLQGLEQVVRRTSLMPGRRSVILVSSGIFLFERESQIDKVVDRALRSNVVISALDPRGLFTNSAGSDSSTPFSATKAEGVFASRTAPFSLAEATGGQFYRDDNDLDAGFRQVGILADASYMLSFSPQNLKYDGRFHKLKVKLVKPSGFSIQARAGYYAPKASEDASANTKEEIEQAVFSHDELKEFPVDVHTSFFKVSESEVRLTVLTHLDLGTLRFRKEQDRNLENMTLVTALFDRDGKFVDGQEKRLELRLRDATLARLTKTGITLKAEFALKPGTYVVREVVRDSEGGQLSGLNRTIEIPY